MFLLDRLSAQFNCACRKERKILLPLDVKLTFAQTIWCNSFTKLSSDSFKQGEGLPVEKQVFSPAFLSGWLSQKWCQYSEITLLKLLFLQNNQLYFVHQSFQWQPLILWGQLNRKNWTLLLSWIPDAPETAKVAMNFDINRYSKPYFSSGIDLI